MYNLKSKKACLTSYNCCISFLYTICCLLFVSFRISLSNLSKVKNFFFLFHRSVELNYERTAAAAAASFVVVVRKTSIAIKLAIFLLDNYFICS